MLARQRRREEAGPARANPCKRGHDTRQSQHGRLSIVVGATGLIGAPLVRALAKRGHAVVAVSRNPLSDPQRGIAALAVDFAAVPSATWWAEHLKGLDVVVNAVGIFRESRSQSFDALHARAPIAKFEGAVQAGVARVLQLSALGSDG